MDKIKSKAESVDLIGGRLCLDFANTADWHTSEKPQEILNTYHDLVVWSQYAGIITDVEAKELLQKAKKSSVKAKKVLVRAIELREVIFRIFSATAKDALPKEEDLAIVNKNLSNTMMHSKIIRKEYGFHWDINGNKDAMDWMLNLIIRSAAELLVSDELKKVKLCADPKCGWLFLDISRNRSRRWCDMKDCGNRAKASRFYNRKRKSRNQ